MPLAVHSALVVASPCVGGTVHETTGCGVEVAIRSGFSAGKFVIGLPLTRARRRGARAHASARGNARTPRFCYTVNGVTATESVRRGTRVEATGGFEPPSRGFADLRVKPLHHVASWLSHGPGRRRKPS